MFYLSAALLRGAISGFALASFSRGSEGAMGGVSPITRGPWVDFDTFELRQCRHKEDLHVKEIPLWPAGHLPHKGGENLRQTLCPN
jgi:hypothetical protein